MRTFYIEHSRVTHASGGEMVTKQEFKDECDINNIISQFKLTGIISHINNNKPLYEDLPSQPDYQTSLNTIIAAEEAFNSLPSTVRDYFNGDPARFLGAFNDPKMEDKLREFGLLNPKPAERQPVQVSVVNPPTTDNNQNSSSSPSTS
jgi:phage internal scaffolding protein